MKTVWLSDVPKEEQQEFLYKLKNSAALDKLRKILSNRLETVERKGLREEEYEDVNWMPKQAFNNGRISTLIEILDLLDFKE